MQNKTNFKAKRLMNFRFPLDDVKIEISIVKKDLELPLYNDGFYRLNQNEFTMQVDGVGSFYVSKGNRIEFAPEPGADNEWINIYLNGQVLAALMHQRKIINFHASSFVYRGKGIMILGETGAGKSSLTTAFALSEGGFLSDDFTPVIFDSGKPLIWPVYKKIKLRENTVHQLGIAPEKIREKESVTGKYFLDVEKANVENYPLHLIIKIEIGENTMPLFYELSMSEKFTLLRSEVCSWEMLAGMPETEKAYFQQLIGMVEQVEMIKVTRPENIAIKTLYSSLTDYINNRD